MVSSSIDTDPIQLVRQLSDNALEIHLKNGHAYTEEIRKDEDLQELILEMMGYEIIEIQIDFHVWPEGQLGKLEMASENDIRLAAKCMYNQVFSATPYLHSKFISAEFFLEEHEIDKKYYDNIYTNYQASLCIRFRGRVDMQDAVADEFDKLLNHGSYTYDFVSPFLNRTALFSDVEIAIGVFDE